jgi:hypothetical protein
MSIDDALPSWDWRSAYATRVAATPERCAEAARAVTSRDLPVTGALMRVRMLGRHRTDDRPLLQSLRGLGLVVLADDPAAVVVGGVLAPWRPRGGHQRVDTIEALRAFATPGWVRVAMAFTVAPEGAGTRVATETRIAATDSLARRRFGRYWRLIAPFSGVTRREMLAAIKRRAEA